jgi:hypothetical protein
LCLLAFVPVETFRNVPLRTRCYLQMSSSVAGRDESKENSCLTQTKVEKWSRSWTRIYIGAHPMNQHPLQITLYVNVVSIKDHSDLYLFSHPDVYVISALVTIASPSSASNEITPPPNFL